MNRPYKARSKYPVFSRILAAVLTLVFMVGLTGAAWSLAEVDNQSKSVTEVFQTAPVMRRSNFEPGLENVYIEAASVELDLSITVFLENGDIATGYEFEFQVWPVDDETDVRTLFDVDKVGQVYIETIEEGDYMVALVGKDGFEAPEPLMVTVEPKVTYEKIDVSDKIAEASEINAAEDDAKYGGGNSNGGSSSPPPASGDTVEYVASSQKEELVTSEKPVLDANNKQVVKYRPVLGANGCLLAANGAETDLIPVLDSDGYLVSVNRLVSGSAAGSEEELPPADPPLDPPPDPPVYEDVTSLVMANGVPISENGVYKYQFTAVPQVETVTETVITYYGWQTLNGKTYFYDKNGKFVTGNQTIQGISYFFSSEGVRGGSIGIDVSTWQDNIDWAKVKAAGIDFAFIRLGFRGYSSGKMVLDNKYHQNMRGATAAGIKVGVYFFTQAINEREAVEEASMCLEMVKGYNVRYPIAIDIEYSGSSSGRANSLTNDQRTKICIAFCETIRNAGYIPSIYANKYYLTSMLNTGQFSSSYVIWLAHYTSQTDYKGRYEIWQHSSTGKVNGISGNVDMNIGYLSY
jgi:GH25 family lysozyme M1 (1,4-beta-N-acetylmuramidase)